MMRKWWVLALAAGSAVLFPVCASAQVAPQKDTGGDAINRYQVYAGFGYTSLNQVNQSRYGLIGVNVAVSRNWGRLFALTVDGAFYPTSLSSGNPGKPSVSSVLAGPEIHAKLYDKLNVFGRALLGGEHTGGNGQTPSTSFAGGGGGGLEYVINNHWAIRASGDVIAASFSVTNNSSQLGYSAHTTRNARAGIGLAYRF